MFRKKKHIKLDKLNKLPSINDLKGALAQVSRSCSIELPWVLENSTQPFILLAQMEAGSSEVTWGLYIGEGNKSRAYWHAPFNDLSLLEEVIRLSVLEIIQEHIEPSPNKNLNMSFNDNYTQVSTQTNIVQQESPAKEINDSSNYSYPAAPQENLTSQNYQPSTPEARSTPTSSPTPASPLESASPSPQTFIPFSQAAISESQPSNAQSSLSPGQTNTSSGLAASLTSSRLPKPDLNLLNKETNYSIGQLLVDSKLVSQATLDAAAKIQDLLIQGYIGEQKACETINRLHYKGGTLDIPALINGSPSFGKDVYTPENNTEPNHIFLGDLLVKSHVINQSVMDAILQMQDIVRSGAISKEEACQTITSELIKISPAKTTTAKAPVSQQEAEERIINLLIRACLITSSDKETALNVKKKHGGQLGQILISSTKLNQSLYDAAAQAETLLQYDKLKVEQAIIALNYCERARTNLNESLRELGFNV